MAVKEGESLEDFVQHVNYMYMYLQLHRLNCHAVDSPRREWSPRTVCGSYTWSLSATVGPLHI